MFLRISLQKINILKKAKLYLTELNEGYDMNRKITVAQFDEFVEIYYKKC
jgi:hypothetical protein